MLFFNILVVDRLALFLPDFLKDHVLGVLGRDPAEAPGLDLVFHRVADPVGRTDPLGLCQGHLHPRILDLFHDLLGDDDVVIRRLRVYGHCHIVCLLVLILIGLQKRLLNSLQKNFPADVLFFFKKCQRFQ